MSIRVLQCVLLIIVGIGVMSCRDNDISVVHYEMINVSDDFGEQTENLSLKLEASINDITTILEGNMVPIPSEVLSQEEILIREFGKSLKKLKTSFSPIEVRVFVEHLYFLVYPSYIPKRKMKSYLHSYYESALKMTITK